jgi:2,5-diketo-D-gluconate reductase A
LHSELKIKTESWSPLGQGQLISEPLFKKLSDKYKRSPAQIILRWHIELGLIAIPKSTTPSRIKENFEIFDFKLDDNDMAMIERLDDKNGKIGPDPRTAEF